jgi:anti-sigma-K factor RskA
MRENLIGYLLNALEPTEQAEIEAELGRDPQLKRELDVLSRSLEPLSWDQGMHNPPVGLASRCCEFVAEQTKVRLPAPTGAPPSSQWRMADLGVAASVFLAASLLFWPAMNQSRYAARVRGCQNNLRRCKKHTSRDA